MEKKNFLGNLMLLFASVLLTAIIVFSYRFISKEYFPDFYSTSTGKVSSYGGLMSSTVGYYTENSAEDLIFSIASNAVFSFSFDISE